jgi:hypothetical protein
MKPVLKENSICQQLHVRILSKMSNLFVWASETGRKATLGRTILSYLQQFQINLTFTSNIHILCILCLSSNDKESKQLPNFTEKSRTKCCSNLSSVSSFSSTLLRFLALPSVWISYQVSFINLWSTYKDKRSRLGCDHMVVGFATTYAISAYHYKNCEFESHSWWYVLDTPCDKAWQWHAAGQWFSPVFYTNKTDHHDITKILLKVALNTLTLPL